MALIERRYIRDVIRLDSAKWQMGAGCFAVAHRARPVAARE
jgi:hypothetical protein